MPDIQNSVIDPVGKILCDKERPMKERFRALFTLKNIGGYESIAWISKCFEDPSVLLKHELAYCLGQMKDPRANNLLIKLLEDQSEDPIVRHEAGEALGAIASRAVLEVLNKYSSDPVTVVSETCQLAVDRITWLESAEYQEHGEELLQKVNPYCSVDPGPALPCNNIEILRQTLLDETQPLFQRYRAMFSLRNIGSKNSVLALSEGFNCRSTLFRHEIAFVFGQIQSEHSVPSLIKVLENLEEHEMVRHESAEALGAIATTECMEILRRYLYDERRVVRESCEVALDISEYENSPEFQYANTILQCPSNQFNVSC